MSRRRPGPVVRGAVVPAAALSVLVGLQLGVTAAPSYADQPQAGDRSHRRDLTSQHRDVTSKVSTTDRELDEDSARLQRATKALLQARTDLTNAQNELSRTQQELAVAESRDRRMQVELDHAVLRLKGARLALVAGEADVTSQQRLLRELVVSSYEQPDPALLGLSHVLNTQDPAEIAGELNSELDVVYSQSATLDRLRAAQLMLSEQRDTVQAAKGAVAERRGAAAANLGRKQELELQAKADAQQVIAMVDQRTSARVTALTAKRSELTELEALQAERDRIEQLIRQQASYTGASSAAGDSSTVLDLPVDGTVTSPYGWRIHPIYGYRSFHDGVDYGAACGTPIRAAADGTVLSEYSQEAWGNRLIIDHGTHRGVGVATISNHLSGYAVGVGAHVRRGQVVGYVGTTGWSTGCHLHFTVLENGTAVDPMSWF